MPSVKTQPDKQQSQQVDHLRAFQFHGVGIDARGGIEQVYGQCPFCGKDGKFGVNQRSGQWRCYSCNEGQQNGKAIQGGNVLSFLRLIWQRSMEQTKDRDSLRKDRKLLSISTLEKWGACRSILTRDWILPGWNAQGQLVQLYRYVRGKDGRMLLMPSPGLGHGIFAVKDSLTWHGIKTVWITEGPWDGMALWETGTQAAMDREGAIVYDAGGSLLKSGLVIAVPGATTFLPSWARLCEGRSVKLLYDNDHPRVGPGGRPIEGAGPAGMRRVAQLLSQADTKPTSVEYLAWGGKEEGYTKDLKSGFDVRDQLARGGDVLIHRLKCLENLLGWLTPVPDSWIPGRSSQAAHGSVEVEPLPCTSWSELINSAKRALRLEDGMEVTFSVMLACVTSTRMPGDQLWIQVVSPASTGKTALCDAINAAGKRWVKSVGNFSGLHSGFQSDADGSEDHSLLVQLKDKTFIVKEGDPIFKAANRDKILAQIRDAYDTHCAVSYGNKVKRDYQGHRFGFILCGTEAMLELDSSELGARFLVVIIMHGIDHATERDISQRKGYSVWRNRAVETNGKMDSHDDPDMLTFKRTCGGYVDYLRQNAARLLGEISDRNIDEVNGKITGLAQLVAYCRARPSKRQSEVATREMAARLQSQLTRLALCLAVVMNKKEVDGEVMRRVKKVALDTCRGKVLEILKPIAAQGMRGSSLNSLAVGTGQTDAHVKDLLVFLGRIGAVKDFVPAKEPRSLKLGLGRHPRWRLTPGLAEIWKETMNDA